MWKEPVKVSKGKTEGGDSPGDRDNKLFSKQFGTVGSGLGNKMHILPSNSVINSRWIRDTSANKLI